MESPRTSNVKITGGTEGIQQLINCTPKNHKSCGLISGELGSYNLYRESSPNFRAGQDVLEIGWGDSPEPLNVEPKFETNGKPVACKKKLEPRESPKSSIPFKRRNVRSSFTVPPKSIIDVAKYVAEVQELSKNIMKQFNAQKFDQDLFQDENVHSCNNSKCISSPEKNTSNGSEIKINSNNSQKEDSSFDSVLQSFINEEDDWLSQALSSQDQVKTPHKGTFVKSKSENELTVSPSISLETHSSRTVNNNFRRTSSFDLTKPQINVNNVNESKQINSTASSNQYSLQEIERKRLEAKYRKERREIERKKLEALKKLEMKKLRVIKT